MATHVARRDSTTIVCGSRGIKEAEKGAVTPAEEGAVLRYIAIKQYSGVMSLETVGWSPTSGVC